jgi:hypothetical protein
MFAPDAFIQAIPVFDVDSLGVAHRFLAGLEEEDMSINSRTCVGCDVIWRKVVGIRTKFAAVRRAFQKIMFECHGQKPQEWKIGQP